MLFQTLEFLIFFAVVFPVYLLSRKTRWGNLWLLLASYFFYGWWNPLYVLLLATSTILDWFVGLALCKFSCRRALVAASVTVNLLFLASFKYIEFITSNVNWVLAKFDIQSVSFQWHWLLPVGISFYTFQSMGYAIDVYRRQLEPERNFIRFAVYVSFFPQLVAGPIERATHLLSQLRTPRHIAWPLISSGCSLFLTGLFKKMVLGDFLGQYVQRVYGTGAIPPEYEHLAGLSVLLATYSFAWQIYFDFSGYTDMARGIARIMGFSLMENFRAPYLASSPSEFWKRWHISLSSWLRDYLYISLGGNRSGTIRTYVNLMVTMLLGGLWHGASWTFVAWGAYHGCLLIIGRLLNEWKWQEKIPLLIRQLFFFHVICISWVFFRANDLGDVFKLFDRLLFHFNFSQRFDMPWLIAVILITAFLIQKAREGTRFAAFEKNPVYTVASHAFMITAILLIPNGTATPFIYFQF